MKTLRDLNPIAAHQWDYKRNGDLTPDNVAGKSGKKAHFICSKNKEHRWETKIYQRTKNGRNIDCPYCNGRLAFPGETDFFTVCPEAKGFWDYENNEGLDPNQLLPTSTKRVNFICSRGHKFNRQISNFTKSPKCPDCYLVENNITETHPDIAAMWDYDKNAPDTPDQFLKTSDTKVWWKCDKCGYSWKSEVASRTASQGLCPNCEANIVFTLGFNDIETKHKEILKYWNYEKNQLKPSKVNQYDDRSVFWKCRDCGYEWEALINSRIKYEKGDLKYVGCLSCEGKTAVKGYNDLITTHPKLAKEFVPELNTVPVTKVRSGSNKIRFWKCSICDQIFPATPNSRTRYKDQELHGCPYCVGKLPIQGINDFKTLHLDLAEEWDYDANELSPEDYTCSSNIEQHWICKSEPMHRWTASINTRTSGYAKCPECSRIEEGRSFAELHPELLKYWDYKLNEKGPEYYTEFSSRSVYWKCDKGHSYEHSIFKYSVHGYYCVICHGLKVIKGVNDLASMYPEFLNIWDFEANDKTPFEISLTPKVCYNYKCEHGHSWNNRIERVIETNFTCDYCSNRRILHDFNSLQALYPEIANEWVYELNDTTPDSIFPENMTYRRWECGDCGQIFSATTKGRTEGTESCPYCAELKATPGVNSFAALYPQLLNTFSKDNPFNPDLVFPSFKKRTIWECHEYGLQWAAPLNDVVEGRRECPYCSGEKAVPGKTSLKALYPELAKEYYDGNPISSDHVLPSYGEYVFWKCQEYGELYRARVREKVDGSATCPYCSGRKAVPGVNSLEALYPEIAMELHKEVYNADNILPTLTSRLEWKCQTYGLPYMATVKGLVDETESCPYCAERQAVPGVNSLKALYPDLIKEEWKFISNILLANPDEILPTNSQQFFWQCSKCGSTYKASPKSRVQNLQRNIESCPTCKGLRQKFINY